MKPKQIPMPSDGELIFKSPRERRVGKIPAEQWVWMGHPAHFIGGFDCRFHMATKVGDYIVSTVGEYLPDYDTREMIAMQKGIKLMGFGDDRRNFYMLKIGFEQIGFNRKYETMVFVAQKSKDKKACCPWVVADATDLAFDGYNDAPSATNGHLKMCELVSGWESV